MLTRMMSLGLAVVAVVSAPKWSAVLRPVNDHDPKGSATAEAGAGTTRVTIELSGAKPGSELPWHIHTGTCNDMGKIWGDPSMYPLLRIGADGAGGGAVTLPVALPSSGDFAVSVHKSADEMTPVACGALLQVPLPDTIRPMKP